MQDNVLAVTTDEETYFVLKVTFFAFQSQAAATAFDEAIFKAISEMPEAAEIGWSTSVSKETV